MSSRATAIDLDDEEDYQQVSSHESDDDDPDFVEVIPKRDSQKKKPSMSEGGSDIRAEQNHNKILKTLPVPCSSSVDPSSLTQPLNLPTQASNSIQKSMNGTSVPPQTLPQPIVALRFDSQQLDCIRCS